MARHPEVCKCGLVKTGRAYALLCPHCDIPCRFNQIHRLSKCPRCVALGITNPGSYR